MPADEYSRMDSCGSTSDSAETTMDKLSSSPGAASNTSSSSRERTDSECSDGYPRFVLAATANTPAKVLTINELKDAISNIKNMTLAHEIAVNPEFKLQPYEPEENSFQKRVKEMVHKAFWAMLREQLNQEPPCYDHAIQLLGEIKEGFSLIISENNQKALDRICEVLDSTIIRQQAEQGVLDFKSYADFIILIMARSCAPVRDENVAKLSEITDVVDTFKGIMETMALMKLDMANCLLEAARKDVVAYSVEYEKERFQEFLSFYSDRGFPATERWLLSHKPADRSSKNWIDVTIINAYIELLDWNDENKYPEMLSMDEERIRTLASKLLRICVCATTLVIASSVPHINSNSANKNKLKEQLTILLENVKNNKDLEDVIENIWIQVKTVITECLQADGKDCELDAESEQTLKAQVLLIAQKDSSIRSIMWKRLLAYVRLSNTQIAPTQPPGYNDFIDELKICIAFKRITYYNYSVFGDHYHKLLNKEDATTSTEELNTTNTTTTSESSSSESAASAASTSTTATTTTNSVTTSTQD